MERRFILKRKMERRFLLSSLKCFLRGGTFVVSNKSNLFFKTPFSHTHTHTHHTIVKKYVGRRGRRILG
jgi:hypothetical protein